MVVVVVLLARLILSLIGVAVVTAVLFPTKSDSSSCTVAETDSRSRLASAAVVEFAVAPASVAVLCVAQSSTDFTAYWAIAAQTSKPRNREWEKNRLKGPDHPNLTALGVRFLLSLG